MISKIKQTLRSIQLHRLKRQGMHVGDDFRCMGGVNFGSEPYLLSFGDHVTISFKVTFITHDGATWVHRQSDAKDFTRFAPIKIGNNCFIGCHSIILPGVQLGDDCIIGAGSVVNKSFSSDSVVTGVPARKVGNTSEYISKSIQKGQLVPNGATKKSTLLELFRQNK